MYLCETQKIKFIDYDYIKQFWITKILVLHFKTVYVLLK